MSAAKKAAQQGRGGKFRVDHVVISKMIVPAGKAAPGPPVGAAFGPRALKAMDFAKEFNARTAHYEPGLPLRVHVQHFPDRTFQFDIRMPQTQWFIKQAAAVERGANGPPKGDFLVGIVPPEVREVGEEVGQITLKHVYEIARLKLQDSTLKHSTLDGMCAIVIANCRQMGVRVVP